MLDALKEIEQNNLSAPVEGKYFLTAIHRQENLMNGNFMKNTFEKIFDMSEDMKCVFIYHIQTENALKKFGLWDRFERCQNIIKIPRQNLFHTILITKSRKLSPKNYLVI